MRAASSGSLVPAMGLADGEGAGDAAGTDGAEWTGSGDGEAAVVLTGVLDALSEPAAEDAAMAGTRGEPKTENKCYRRNNKPTNCVLCKLAKPLMSLIILLYA